MDCNEFKNKVVDLFDTNVDAVTRKECFAHMDTCPECKQYYEELKTTFDEIAPKKAFGSALPPQFRLRMEPSLLVHSTCRTVHSLLSVRRHDVCAECGKLQDGSICQDNA